MKKIINKLMLAAFLLSTLFAAGCGQTQTSEATERTGVSAYAASFDVVDETGKYTLVQETQETGYTESYLTEEYEVTLDKDGTYDSKDDVALYIHLYGELPSNYITKKEAKALGWEGGSLEAYAPGKCIGGDYFGNYEGLLPDEKTYHECDIDTLGKSKRGAKRIIYSTDGYIYYTEDHYESFELLYEG